jgi:hypothetical protein
VENSGPDRVDAETKTRSSPERIEALVLRRLLDLHPATLTKAELVLDLSGGTPASPPESEIEAAITGLVSAGLVHESDFLRPTRAAVYLAALSSDARTI